MNLFGKRNLKSVQAAILISILTTALAVVVQLAGSTLAHAAIQEGAAVESAQTTDSAKAQAKLKTKKSTEVNFDDVLVQGKYHFSDEAVTTVEQDKILDALLGVRTDFKDRLSKSAARH